MFSISNSVKSVACLGLLVLTGCAELGRAREQTPAPAEFYTLTAEIALAEGEPRVAALQYAVAATRDPNPQLLQRATEVGAETLQPSLSYRPNANSDIVFRTTYPKCA